MPDGDTVWLAPPDAMLTSLARVGLEVTWQKECNESHRAVADSLIDAFTADATDITAQIGSQTLDGLLVAHRLWSDWLEAGRARMFAFVAERASQA